MAVAWEMLALEAEEKEAMRFGRAARK